MRSTSPSTCACSSARCARRSSRPARPRYIVTEPWVGYRFATADRESGCESSARLSSSTLTRGSPRKSELASFGAASTSARTSRVADARVAGDSRNLKGRACRRQMRIQPGAEVVTSSTGTASADSCRATGDDRLRRDRSASGSSGRGSSRPTRRRRSRRRRPMAAARNTRRVKRLPDEARAHDPAIALDQLAVRLVGNSTCARPVTRAGRRRQTARRDERHQRAMTDCAKDDS